MPRIRMSAALAREIRTLYGVGVIGNLPDGRLLDRFMAGGDDSEAAFAALVARHGPMVLRVCRSVLGNVHDADDAFQATFLILANRARSIRRRSSLGPWLHGVALRAANVSRRAASRRRFHERRGAEMAARQPRKCSSTDELGPEIHEEIARLPESYRAPIVLCYLEGMTHEMAAEHLRWPVGTVRGRLSRARDRLRGRLIRRGLAPSVGLAAFAGASGKLYAAPRVPEALANAVIQAAVKVSSGGGLAVAAGTIANIAEGVMRPMMLNQLLKLGWATILVVGIATTSTLMVVKGQGGAGGGSPAATDEISSIGQARKPAPKVDQDAPRGDWDDLKGEWEVMSVTANGQRLEPGDMPFNECAILPPKPNVESGTGSVGWLVFFLDGRLFQEWPVHRIDPEARPNTLRIQSKAAGLLDTDIDPRGLFYHAGIYKLQDVELTICLGEGDARGQPARPETFGAGAGTGETQIVLKRLHEPTTAQRTRAILNALGQPLTMSFDDETPLEDVLIHIKTATKRFRLPEGLSIYVDPRGLTEVGARMSTPVSIEMEGVPLGLALRLILDQIGLGYRVRDGFLTITSGPTELPEELRLDVYRNHRAKAIREALATEIDMPFAQEASLEDVLRYIKTSTVSDDLPDGLPIYVDPRSLREAERTKASTVAYDSRSEPAEAALRAVLELLGLTYEVRDGLLQITASLHAEEPGAEGDKAP